MFVAKDKSTSRFSAWVPFLLVGLLVTGSCSAAIPAYLILKDEAHQDEKKLVRDSLAESLGHRDWVEVKWVHADGKDADKGKRLVTLTFKSKNGFGMEVTGTLLFTIDKGKITNVEVK